MCVFKHTAYNFYLSVYLFIFLDGIPRPKPEISIPTSVAYGKDVTLKCSAIGAVKLTWYKSKRNGTRNDWQLMDAVEADQTFHPRTGLRETKRFLVIKKFNVSDSGVYICDLYRYYVNWRAHKETYVGIKGMYIARMVNSLWLSCVQLRNS